MNNFTGKTLSWRLDDGVLDLELHREPCNESGSDTLEELEQCVQALSSAGEEGNREQGIGNRRTGSVNDRNESASVVIIHSSLSSGFSAGADLRELYYRSQKPSGAARIAGVRDFLERIHRVLTAIDRSPLVTIAAV